MKALELLDDASRYISPQRYLVFLDILRAKCYIEKKKPEYEKAIYRLMDAIAICKELRVSHNIAQIYKLYTKLAASSYGNAPDVVELEHGIRELKLMTL